MRLTDNGIFHQIFLRCALQSRVCGNFTGSAYRMKTEELAVTWSHYARFENAMFTPLTWDTDSTGMNLFATLRLSRVYIHICLCIYVTCTHRAVLETISRQLGGRKKHPPTISFRRRASRRLGTFVIAYLCTNRLNRVKTHALLIGVYGSLRIQHSRDKSAAHGDRENDAHRERPTERAPTWPFRDGGRSATDSMRVALARSRRRFAAKCAPHTISTGPELRAITCQSLMPRTIIFHAPTS